MNIKPYLFYIFRDYKTKKSPFFANIRDFYKVILTGKRFFCKDLNFTQETSKIKPRNLKT